MSVVMHYPCFLDTVPLFVGAARNAGFTGIIMGGDGWDGSDTTGLEDKFEGCYFTNHYSSEDTAPAVVNFVEKFTAKYGTESLNACAALYYDAMYMLVEAAKNGGGTDTASLIAGMKGMSFTGVGGDITLYGLLASMFFALTFILNRSMNLGGATGCGALLCVTCLCFRCSGCCCEGKKRTGQFSGKSAPGP